MKYFLISDVHGHYTEMVEALKEKGFDSSNVDHQLIILGDLFDRGTENLKVLEYVYDLLEKGKVLLIKGNHDDFFYDSGSLEWNIERNGFDKTIMEFFDFSIAKHGLSNYELLNAVLESQPKLQKVLKAMVDKIIIDDKYVLIHGGLSLGQPDNWCNTERWIWVGVNEYDDKTYIFGHWGAYQLNKKFKGVHEDAPFIYKNYIGIDNTVVLTKKVFVYIIESENSKGEE